MTSTNVAAGWLVLGRSEMWASVAVSCRIMSAGTITGVTRCHVSCVTMLVTRHVLHPITRPLLCYCPHVLPPPPQHKPPPILEFLNCDINTFRKPLDKALHWHD